MERLVSDLEREVPAVEGHVRHRTSRRSCRWQQHHTWGTSRDASLRRSKSESLNRRKRCRLAEVESLSSREVHVGFSCQIDLGCGVARKLRVGWDAGGEPVYLSSRIQPDRYSRP